jgi:hypothetical protein
MLHDHMLHATHATCHMLMMPHSPRHMPHATPHATCRRLATCHATLPHAYIAIRYATCAHAMLHAIRWLRWLRHMLPPRYATCHMPHDPLLHAITHINMLFRHTCLHAATYACMLPHIPCHGAQLCYMPHCSCYTLRLRR